jgi:site-specific recombinase XerD
MTPIAPLIEAFLRETLASQRGASRHTQDSYAASFQLLFTFAAERLKVRPSALTLEQIDAGLVSAFLEHLADSDFVGIRKHLEDVRKNAAVTRNVRLAAIKSFFGWRCHINSVVPLRTVCSGDQAAMATEFH